MKLLLFMVVTLFCTHSEARTTGIREFERKWFSEDNVTYFVDPYFNENEHFIFATCIKENHDKQVNCNITIETPIIQDAVIAKQSCKIKRDASDIAAEKGFLDSISRIETMNKLSDRILISGFRSDRESETITFIVTILHLKTCSSIDLTFDMAPWSNSFVAQVLPYENTFDIFIYNNVTCSGAQACKITYDKNGNPISGPVPFTTISNTVVLYLFTVARKSPVKGFFGLEFDILEPGHTLKYYSQGNKKIDLLGTRSELTDLSQISNSYEKIGYCYQDLESEAGIHCFQLDPEFQKTLINETFKLNLEPGEYFQTLGVHNLKTGGLLSTSLVKCRKNSVCNVDSLKFVVTKISSGRYQKEVIKIDEISAKYNERSPTLSVTENDKEFCFYIVWTIKCDGSPLSSHLSMKVKCIPIVMVYGL